jgi:hypothetical protein
MVLLAGYTASRTSAFAAGGGTNCLPCKDCAMLDTWYNTGVNTNDFGMVTDGTDTPTQTALLGTDQGGTRDAYATSCYLYGASGNPPVMLEAVTYTSASPGCTPSYPMPPGVYEATNGQGIKHSGETQTQQICYSVG